jgi:Zn-dependent protease
VVIPDISLQQLLERIVAYALAIGVYGFVATWLVDRLGDEGPKHDGRRSLNALRHLDLLGLLAAVFFRTAWMRPLDIDTGAFRRPRAAAAAVVVGSSLSLAAFGAVCLAARPLAPGVFGSDAAVVLSNVLLITFDVSVSAAALNLLPIPPLTGSLWLAAATPRAQRWIRHPNVRLLGSILLAASLMLGALGPPLRAVVTTVRSGLGF